MIRNMNTNMDLNRLPIPLDQLDTMALKYELDANKLNEDLWFILVAKTDGEAANRVMSSQEGQGIIAYMSIYIYTDGLPDNRRWHYQGVWSGV